MAIAFGGGAAIVVSSLIGSVGRRQEPKSDASAQTVSGVAEEMAGSQNEPCRLQPAPAAAGTLVRKKEKVHKEPKRKPAESDDAYARRIARRRDRKQKRKSVNQPGEVALS
jgi:hypothetical protein